MPYQSKEDKFNLAYKRLKNINPNMSEVELREKAQDLVNQKAQVDDIDIESMFTKRDEQKLGAELLRKYLQDYTIETISDKNTLRQVIYLEVLNVRLQDALNDLQKNINVVPEKIVKTVHENIREIVSLKDKLGITRAKEQESVKDGYGYLQLIKRKFKVWLRENQGTRHLFCPHCAKMIMLVIRADAWTALKHPFFRDRILGNERLIELYKENKITRQDVAKIFGTSEDYVDWLITKGWGLTLKEAKQEEQGGSK